MSQPGNFSFLAEHSPLLAQLGAAAERTFAADPNTTLIKLRQFGEAMAQDLASRFGVAFDQTTKQSDLLFQLDREAGLDKTIRGLFHNLYNLNGKQQAFQRNKAFLGMELVSSTRRLALMNCMLHGMEGDDEGVVHIGNTLGNAGAALPKADIILSNPPFGTAKGGGGPTRDDLTYATGNKQLAFLQHIVRHLKDGGECGRAPDASAAREGLLW